MTTPEETCRSLSARFYRLLDAGDYDALVDLFSPEGVWLRQGVHLSGPQEIKAALQKRSPAVVIRHLLTTVEVEAQGDDAIDVLDAVLVFRAPRISDEGPQTMPPGPSTLMTIRDRFQRVDGLWKLSEKTGERILVSEPATH